MRGDGRRRDLRRLKEHLGVGNDETTADGKVTLEHVECNAACDYAPVMMVNWEFFDNMTPQSARELVDDLRSGRASDGRADPGGAAAAAPGGGRARILAGFPDDQAGAAAAPARPTPAWPGCG